MLAVAALLGSLAAAQEPVAEVPPPPVVDPAAVHDALRALRAELLAALEARDKAALLKTLHPDVVFTTTTGEVARGHDGVAAYVDRMLEGPDAVVASFDFDVKADELSILHGGDTAIAWGPAADHYVFTNGDTADLDTRWSATLVQQDGRWLVASVHSSVDVFDNTVLDRVAGMVPKVGLGAGLGGLMVGAGVGLLIGRRKKG